MVKLLAYISDKDLFAEFYRKKLARHGGMGGWFVCFGSLHASSQVFTPLFEASNLQAISAARYPNFTLCQNSPRRLLHEKSSSDDHERSILSRLKQQCGAQFTSKVKGSQGGGRPQERIKQPSILNNLPLPSRFLK